MMSKNSSGRNYSSTSSDKLFPAWARDPSSTTGMFALFALCMAYSLTTTTLAAPAPAYSPGAFVNEYLASQGQHQKMQLQHRAEDAGEVGGRNAFAEAAAAASYPRRWVFYGLPGLVHRFYQEGQPLVNLQTKRMAPTFDMDYYESEQQQYPAAGEGVKTAVKKWSRFEPSIRFN